MNEHTFSYPIYIVCEGDSHLLIPFASLPAIEVETALTIYPCLAINQRTDEHLPLEQLLFSAESLAKIQLNPQQNRTSPRQLRFPSFSYFDLETILLYCEIRDSKENLLVFSETDVHDLQLKLSTDYPFKPALHRMTDQIYISNSSQDFGSIQPNQKRTISCCSDQTAKKMKKLPPIRTCSICENTSSRNVRLADEVFCPQNELLCLCDNPEHVYCAGCIVKQFKTTKQLPCCRECPPTEDSGHLPIPYEQCRNIFQLQSMVDGELEEEEIVDVDDMEDLSVDALESDGSTFEEMMRYYYIFQNGMYRNCICSGHDIANQGRHSISGPMVFDEHTLFPYTSSEEPDVMTFTEHEPTCFHCLQRYHDGPCLPTQNLLNPFFRGKNIGRLYMNKEISIGMAIDFVVQLMSKTEETYMVVCPGCENNIYKTEACNEIACPCGYKICYSCNHAVFTNGQPMLDHFTENPTNGGCPRYDSNHRFFHDKEETKAMVGCDSTCHSHEYGPCKKKEHELFRKTLLFYRKQKTLFQFVQSLPADRFAAVMQFCIINNLFIDQ